MALRNKTNLSLWLKKFAPDLTLENCDRNSPRQLWQYTSGDQLKLSYNGMCLTYDSTTEIHFQPCTTLNENQRWRCIGNKLKLRTKLQYLVSFMYSGLPYGYNIKALWYCAFDSCSWSRFDTGLSVCSNGTFFFFDKIKLHVHLNFSNKRSMLNVATWASANQA